MKFALITAPNGFEILDVLHLSYHLVLAQYKDDYAYLSRYKVAHRLGDFVMVDNGAAELGRSIPFEQVLDFANAIRADEVILPDVLDDSVATVKSSIETAHFLPPKKCAVVPQGSNWDEWTWCLKELLSLGCRTICIAKRYERLPGGRPHALGILRKMDLLDRYDIHLLGFDGDPLKEIREALACYQGIRGVDSAVPLAWAQQGMQLGEAHRSYTWGGRFVGALATYNARQILSACNTEFICTS